MAFQSVASIGTGIVIGLVYGWRLALFIIALVPLFLISGILQMKVIKGFSGKNSEALENAGRVGRCFTV
jgi:ATP-binding cassette subfamily B (MDR/TAP) protein 1